MENIFQKKLNKSLFWVGTLCPMVVNVSAEEKNTTSKPNIICILADDLGYGDVSSQGFAKDLHTPNIDALLNGGCRFTNFYANSNVSSPSRAALLTGCYPDKVGVPGVIRTHPEDSWGYLSPAAILLPQVLKESGYHSAIIGKWHLGLESPNTPLERGFDYFHGFLGDMMDNYYTHLRWGNNYMRENDAVIHTQGKHATELFSDWAIEYLNQQKESSSPFFLYLAYNAPHTPLQPPTDFLDKVKKRESGISERRATLVALIEHMDYNIGRVIKTLENNNMLDNTLIIFVSDNGGDNGANNGPVRGRKGNMFEGGIRVPAGFYWRGNIKPSVSENFAMLSDIFPTLCELTGSVYTHNIDGISILPTIYGEKQTTDDRIVHWVRREGGYYFGGKDCYASRYKEYKILQNDPFQPLLFFNLQTDPKETTPLKHKDSPQFKDLFKGQMIHIQEAAKTPWIK